MVWGDVTRYRWGAFKWGDVSAEDAPRVFADCVAEKVDDDAEWLADALAEALDRSAVVDADGLALATTDASFAVDAYTLRITDGWAKQSISPLVLVELRLAAGTVRVAVRDVVVGGLAWAGRLVESGRILRTLGAGTEDMSIELDDTSTRGSRFRDLFRANAPEGRGVSVYLALDGDPAENLLHVWEGRIDRVASFSRSTVRVDVLRTENVDDRLLGRVVTTDDHPDAPDESLGLMVPIVFGTVEAHEGIVTNTQAVSQLAQNVFKADTSIILRDASGFPTSGVLKIEREEIAWGGKSGNVLTNVHRGFNGTTAADHPKGSDAIEAGTFEVTFADHALSKVENVRIMDSTGELGEPVPPPDTVDHANGRARWSTGIPRIRTESAEPVYQRVHFHEADSANLATNPLRAARESVGYDALGYADLASGDLVLRTNAEGLGEPGDIQSVWLGVIFDPESIGNAPDGARAVLPNGRHFSLVPSDLVPDEIARHDERTGDRLYEVTDDPFTLNLGEEDETLQPNEVIHPGIWVNETMAGRAIDGNEDTFAAYFFASAGEAQLLGSAIARFRLAPAPDLSGVEITEAKLVMVAGWQYTPFTSPYTARLVKRNDDGTTTVIPGAEVLCDSGAPAGVPAGLIRGIETFEQTFDPAGLPDDLSTVEWQVAPKLGVSSGVWVGRELRLEIKTRRTATGSANIDPNRTVTNYFEVGGRTNTASLFSARAAVLALTAAAVSYDWGFFSDLARGGKITIQARNGNSPRILEAFWVVKHAPFEEASTRTPRVFADVTGRVPAGNPVDVMESIVTEAAPGGMGLSAVDRLARDAYLAARASTLADAVVVGFALRDRASAVDLLQRVADQADLRQGWDRGRHTISRKPRADTAATARLTIRESDVIRGSLVPSRTALGEVRTRLVGLFRPYAPTGQPSRTVEVVDAAAESTFGRLEEQRTLDLVRDATTASLVLTRDIERRRTPRWVVTFEVPPMGLELRIGDVVTLDHPDFAGLVCEVRDLHLETRGLIRLVVRVVCWLLE